MLRKAPRPLNFRVNKDTDYWFLDSEDCTILERQAWFELRAMIDAFYARFDDEAIEQHNKEVLEDAARKLDEDMQRLNAPATKTHRDAGPGYIYLIHGEGTNWYKVGLSVDPDLRVNQLGTRSPFPLVIVDYFDVDNMLETEAWWHETFAHKRAHGEWFELDEYDVDLFIAQEGRPIL